jgi:peptidoglycan hydrolase CwlO-like protein
MSNDLDDKAEDFLITIASRDAEIHELQQTIASRDAEIHELQQTIARFRSDLETIYCSRSWRIVSLVRRFRNILFTGSDL